MMSARPSRAISSRMAGVRTLTGTPAPYHPPTGAVTDVASQERCGRLAQGPGFSRGGSGRWPSRLTDARERSGCSQP